ncbi:MAG: tape measure protein, partial [Gammaproteobacteria bacterium]
RRLTFLARGYGEIALAQRAAARTGRQFGLSITESNQQFAQLYGRLRPLNVSLDDIEAAFVGFNTAAKVSGATTAETAGALLQLTQALGSGVLRGQELNSVLEQAPGLVVALTRELNAPISQIRKLAEEGKITSDVVIRALRRAGSEGADQLADAMKGPAQQVKNLQNEFENLQVEVAQVVMPAVIDSIRRITDALKTAIQYVQDYKEGWELISTAVGNLISPFQGVLNVLGQIDARMRSIFQNPALAMLLSLAPGGAIAPVLNAPAQIGAARRQARQGAYVSRFAGARDEAFARARMIGEAVPAGTPPADTDTGGRKRASGADKAARDAERAAKAAADELA